LKINEKIKIKIIIKNDLFKSILNIKKN